MKKIVFLHLLMICGFSNIYGQRGTHKVELGTRSGEMVFKEYIGFSSQYLFVVDVEASVTKSKFSQNIAIISVAGYPLALFTNENKNIDNLFNVIKESIDGEYENYILFVTLKSIDSEGYHVRLFTDIPASAFPAQCIQKTDFFQTYFNLTFNEYNQKTENNEIYGPVYKTLMDINAFLDNGCNMSSQQEDKVFIASGFETIAYDPNQKIVKTSNESSELSSGSVTIKNYGSLEFNKVNPLEFATGFVNEHKLTYLIVFSSKNDISKFDEINGAFKLSEAKIKIWIHMDFIVEVDLLNGVKGPGTGSRIMQARNIRVKMDNTLSFEESNAILDAEYQKVIASQPSNCTFPSATLGKDCFVPFFTNNSTFGVSGDLNKFNVNLVGGVLDGLLGSLAFIYNSGRTIGQAFIDGDWIPYAELLFMPGTYFGKIIAKATLSQTFRKKLQKDIAAFQVEMYQLGETYKEVYNNLKTLTVSKLLEVGRQIMEAFDCWLNEYVAQGTFIADTGYAVGLIVFEVILTVISDGTYVALEGSKMGIKFIEFIKMVFKPAAKFYDELAAILHTSKNNIGKLKCNLLKLGCFVKDTPILMVSNRSGLQDQNEAIRNGFIDCEPSQTWLGLDKSLGNTGYGLALAVMPIITPIPIQDVQLFDYAVAHKSVNASYGQTANADDTYIIGNDPYTSDQQRSRDQYEINETDWNEVRFVQIDGTSQCKLALYNEWIDQNNYVVDAVVNMNLPEQDDRVVSDEVRKSSDTKSLDKKVTETNWISASTNVFRVGWNVGDVQYLNIPEMGISGPFLITSIKHIIPQKKPVDEDEADDYEYRPVTGLFVHESNDVWKIKFDDGSELGVTNNHPIFSVNKGDWQHAGHLEIGEEVLAKGGNTKVVSKERDQALQPVYNLEVKDLHNFLVGDVGVVVHNTGLCDLFDHIFKGKIEITGGVPGAYKFKITGVHHKNALDGVKARIKEGTKTTPNAKGYYKGKVEMHHPDNPNNGGWKTKDEASTFFPDDWDQNKVTDEIAHGLANKQKKQTLVRTRADGSSYTVERFEGTTSDITKLQIYIEKGKDIPETVFPDID